MFGKKQEEKPIPSKLICPLLKEVCSEKCAWSINYDGQIECAIAVIVANQ